jgi:hypothetical protein
MAAFGQQGGAAGAGFGAFGQNTGGAFGAPAGGGFGAPATTGLLQMAEIRPVGDVVVMVNHSVSGNTIPGGRVEHPDAVQAMLRALRINTSKDRASEQDCALAVQELKPLLELAHDKKALKRALESLKEAKRKAIKESIKAALTNSGGSAQLGDIQNLLIMMHDDPSVAMDLIAEAYKEKVEADQYAQLLSMIDVYKQNLKPMSYKNHEGLPNMRLPANWLGWWPVCTQNAFWVCHKPPEGAQPTGDPDDCCPCYRPPPPPPPPGGGDEAGCCCPKQPPPPPQSSQRYEDVIGCTCMGTHCSCLMCLEFARKIPFNWTEERVYKVVEADNKPVICKVPKVLPQALTMGAVTWTPSSHGSG